MAKKKNTKKKTAAKTKGFSPDSIRMLWTGFAAILMAVLLLEYAMHPHAVFGMEATPFFHAWYGFAACAAIVVLSRWLGLLLKRPEDYYGEEER